MDYASKLRSIRKAEGFTQKRFAGITGISHSTVRNYESGQKEIGLSVITRILNIPQLAKYAA